LADRKEKPKNHQPKNPNEKIPHLRNRSPFFATTVRGVRLTETEMLQFKEKAAWQALQKTKRAMTLRKLVAPNMMAVYADGDLQHAERAGYDDEDGK